jgi:hypothetical protein
MCAFAPYDIENVKVIGYDVVSNRPKVAAVPGARRPISEFAGRERGRRDRQEARRSIRSSFGSERGARGDEGRVRAEVRPIGLVDTLHAWRRPITTRPARPLARPRCRLGFWFNIGGETCVSLTVNEDGRCRSLPARRTSAACAPRSRWSRRTSSACPTTRCVPSSVTRARSASTSSPWQPFVRSRQHGVVEAAGRSRPISVAASPTVGVPVEHFSSRTAR